MIDRFLFIFYFYLTFLFQFTQRQITFDGLKNFRVFILLTELSKSMFIFIRAIESYLYRFNNYRRRDGFTVLEFTVSINGVVLFFFILYNNCRTVSTVIFYRNYKIIVFSIFFKSILSQRNSIILFFLYINY